MNSPRPQPDSLGHAELFIDPPAAVADNRTEFSCRLVENNNDIRRIWFRFPREFSDQLTTRADPFILATLVYSVGRFSRMRVHGEVSDGLLANLADFQEAFAALRKRSVKRTEYLPTRTISASGTQSTGGITAFSGGVDSCFSAFQHTAVSTIGPKRALKAALMMHGFDIPLSDPATFSRSAARSRHLTDDAGLTLFCGATNIRELPLPWEEYFATAVAASLSFFQSTYAFGLIPSCHDWHHAHFDNGSNPLMDPLLSSLSFQLIHDGAGYGRIEKLRHLAQWPAALRHLRVCWQGQQLDRNCCRCEKCVRTMLMLRLCGVTQCEAFPEELDLRQLETLVIKSTGAMDEFAYLLAEAHQRGINEPWVAPATTALRRNVRRHKLRRRSRALINKIPVGMRKIFRGATGRSPSVATKRTGTGSRPANVVTS